MVDDPAEPSDDLLVELDELWTQLTEAEQSALNHRQGDPKTFAGTDGSSVSCPT